MRRAIWLIGALGAGLAGAAQAEHADFSDWVVVCDNVRTCSAYGFPAELGDDIIYLRVTRSGEPGAAPRATIVAAGVDSGAWRLQVDGKTIAERLPFRAGEGDVFRRAELSPAQAGALLQAAPNGAAISVIEPGSAPQTISLKGSSAALRWMDDRQKRAGTVTALVAKGPAPASAVPAVPPPPVVRAAAPVSQAGVPTRLPPSLKGRLGECDEDIESIAEPAAYRLAPGLLLWQVACSRGAYNVVYDFFLTDERGGDVRTPAIPYPNGETTGSLMNAEFEPATQTLSNFDKLRGLGDCGAFASWVWTGQAFALKSSEVMPECRGALQDDWASEFVSR